MTTARSAQPLLIVFADITRFCQHARALDDGALADLLDAYYRFVDHLMLRASGQIIKFMGDAFLAVWMREQIAAGLGELPIVKREVDAWWATHGWDTRLVIKAHVGSAVLGPFGNDSRLDVIGNAVNLTAELPGDAITLSSDAYLQLPPAARAGWQARADGAHYVPVDVT